MGYNPLADNAELTAAHLLAEVYNQVISQVTSASRPASPAEGQKIYETDTDREYTWNGSLWVQTGSVGAGFSWTPTITQGVDITKTLVQSVYHKHGRLVTLILNATLTSAGSGSNVVIAVTGLPFNQAHVGGQYGCGGAIFYDASVTTIYPYMPTVVDATTIKFTQTDAPHTVNLFAGMSGSTFGGAVASGDSLQFVHTYESTT